MAGVHARCQLFDAVPLPRAGNCDTAIGKRPCAGAFLVPRQAIARVVVVLNGDTIKALIKIAETIGKIRVPGLLLLWEWIAVKGHVRVKILVDCILEVRTNNLFPFFLRGGSEVRIARHDGVIDTPTHTPTFMNDGEAFNSMRDKIFPSERNCSLFKAGELLVFTPVGIETVLTVVSV